MTNLKILNAVGYCYGIDDIGIKNLNFVNILYISNKDKITEHAAKHVSRFAR